MVMFCYYGYFQNIYFTMCLGAIIWLYFVINTIPRSSTTICVLGHFYAMFSDDGYSQDIFYTMCLGVIVRICTVIVAILGYLYYLSWFHR